MSIQETCAPSSGYSTFFITETTSTMDEARVLAAGHPAGFVRAEAQSSGRGRLPGRNWHSDPGASLLATYWFPAGTFGDAPLPHVAALSLVGAIESWASGNKARFRNKLELKWPNDVLCGGKKLAGILCESGGGRMFAGIGVNCSQRGFPEGFRTEPTSIFLETGDAPAPGLLAEILMGTFHDRGSGVMPWKAAYESMMAWRGSRIEFSPGFGQAGIAGELVGVDDAGALVMATRRGIRCFHSGELISVIDDQGRT
jgi:BirA family transcriptional regulator, biotin operon repressor / biotin---[acetyl-CoA-carboxylase] ligase